MTKIISPIDSFVSRYRLENDTVKNDRGSLEFSSLTQIPFLTAAVGVFPNKIRDAFYFHF